MRQIPVREPRDCRLFPEAVSLRKAIPLRFPAFLLALGANLLPGRAIAAIGHSGELLTNSVLQSQTQIRFTQDRATALVGRKTNLQLTVDPPTASEVSLVVQASDPRVLYTLGIDVFPNQSAVIVPVWATQASYSPVTVTATLLLDSMTAPSATMVLDASNPRPIMTGIDPTSVHAGSPGIMLLVIGSQTPSLTFVSNSVVYWNGSPRPTRPVPISICPDVCLELLYVSLSAADLASPGTATLLVFNPPPGGGASNEVTFQITRASRNRERKPTQTITFHDLLAKKPIGPRP